MISCTGCLCCTVLWRNRGPARSAARSDRRPLHQCTHWRLHHQTLRPSPHAGAVRLSPMACRLPLSLHCHRRHADHENHASSSRRDGPARCGKCGHLRNVVVLPSGSSPLVNACSRHSPPHKQYTASLSCFLVRACCGSSSTTALLSCVPHTNPDR